MKNSADQGRCYPQRPKPEVDNTLRDLQISSHPTKAEFNNCFIILSKYFPATNALETLKWKRLDERRPIHWRLFNFRCLNDIIDFDSILSIILPFIIIIHASVTNCIFRLPKQTGENKNWRTRQQNILTILIQKFRELSRFYCLKRKCGFYRSILLIS